GLAAARPLGRTAAESLGGQRGAPRSRVYVTSPAPVAAQGTTPSLRPLQSNGPAPNARPDWLHSPASASGMMLMVSVQNMEEALEAERGGADIVDIKNLQEAMVGSGNPMLARAVRARIPAEKHVSCTLGVVPNQPGTVAMAV